MAHNEEFGFGVGKTKLSLSYAFVNHIPSKVVASVGKRLLWLDLGHNEFRKLGFLEQFPALETLILDGNSQLDCSTLPRMENLRSLSINNCNINDITEWLSILQEKCPNLEELSMTCNPVCKTVLRGCTCAEERKYRKQFIRALPRLKLFDDIEVSKSARRKARKLSLVKVIRQKLNSIKNFTMQLK